jgi:hypothetical protein
MHSRQAFAYWFERMVKPLVSVGCLPVFDLAQEVVVLSIDAGAVHGVVEVQIPGLYLLILFLPQMEV